MRISARLLVLAPMVPLAACSGSGITAPLPTPAPLSSDAAVAALLPSGPQQVHIVSEMGEVTVETTGYIDLGTSGDGSDCSYDLTVVADRSLLEGEGPESVTLETRKAPGGDAFYRSNPLRKGASAEWGEWVDGNGYFWPPVLFFGLFAPAVPAQVFEELGLCAMAFLDKLTVVADPSTGLLAWDTDAIGQLRTHAAIRWTDRLLDATEAAGRVRATAQEVLAETLAAAPMTSLMVRHELSVAVEGDTVTFAQSTDSGPAWITARFTPTGAAAVAAPDAVGYFAQLNRDGVRIKNSGDFDAFLEKFTSSIISVPD
jgi:hypothetical protein